MIFLIIAVSALLAGIVQGVTGFGSGLVMMMFLPHFFPIPKSAGISVAIALAIGVAMYLRYRRELEFKKALIPSFLFMAASSIAIRFSSAADPAVVKKIFGVFLLVLSVYYLFFQKAKPVKKMKLPAALICIIISGVCDGMFGIGGPLMVLYYLGNTKTKREYLGTLQLFLLITSIYTTIFRTVTGIIGPSSLPYIAIGWAGILTGAFFATRIVDRINADMLRKLVYIMIGISGIVSLI